MLLPDGLEVLELLPDRSDELLFPSVTVVRASGSCSRRSSADALPANYRLINRRLIQSGGLRYNRKPCFVLRLHLQQDALFLNVWDRKRNIQTLLETLLRLIQ